MEQRQLADATCEPPDAGTFGAYLWDVGASLTLCYLFMEQPTTMCLALPTGGILGKANAMSTVRRGPGTLYV